METTMKTKKKRNTRVNKKLIWDTFSDEIKEMNNIETIIFMSINIMNLTNYLVSST